MAVVVRVIVCADCTTPRGVVCDVVVSDIVVVTELSGRPRPRCCAPAGTVANRAIRAPIAIRVALMPCFLVDERGQVWRLRKAGSRKRGQNAGVLDPRGWASPSDRRPAPFHVGCQIPDISYIPVSE